jgi:Pvc16 N-terminal domain
MSRPSAIAAVTTALQNMIQTAISNPTSDAEVQDGRVTSRPPDKARADGLFNQVNVFLYRTAVDAAWRNQQPPGLRPGEVGYPPLPLVLSYVVTAYGRDDDEILAHRLLGIAMSTMHDEPVLSPAALAAAGPGSRIDSQPERIRIVPGPIPQDEISRMWSTFHTGYRTSATYDVGVVLIDSNRTATAAPPVQIRGADDRGPSVIATLAPRLTSVPTFLQPDATTLATDFVLGGENLDALDTLVLGGPGLADNGQTLAGVFTGTEIRATIPAGVAAGSYLIWARKADGSAPSTAHVPISLSPIILTKSPIRQPLSSANRRPPARATSKVIQFAPAVSVGQSVSVVVGRVVVPATVTIERPDQATFDLTPLGLLGKGRYPLELRIGPQSSRSPEGPASHELMLT